MSLDIDLVEKWEGVVFSKLFKHFNIYDKDKT